MSRSSAIEELARVLRQPRFLADAEMIRAMRTLMDGKLDEGAELARHALTLNQQVRPEIAMTLYGSQMFYTVWREKGQLAELETGMKAILDYVGAIPAAIIGLAFVRSEQGKREEARAEFDSIAADDFSSIPREAAWTSVMANLTEVCCFLGDVARAHVLYEQIRPFAALNVMLGAVPHACCGPDRALPRHARSDARREREGGGALRATRCRWRRGCGCRRPARARSASTVACSCAAIAGSDAKTRREAPDEPRWRPHARSG